jgi:hypothetical protein
MNSRIRKSGRIAGFLALGSIAATSFCSLRLPAFHAALPAALQSSEQEVQRTVMSKLLSSGSLRIPAYHSLRAVATGDRAAIATETVQYLKAYCASQDFRDAYQAERERYRPQEQAPTDPALLAQQKSIINEAIKQYEELAKSMTGTAKKEMEKAIATYRDELRKIENPNAEALKKWEAEYPARPDGKIRARLQEFLALTADVDFGAKLYKGSSGKMYFEKTEYQNKSAEWKMCYRAGEAATAAVRRAASQWLATLN